MRAQYNGTTIADSDKTIVVEGNHYFPPDSINMDFFEKSDMHSTCPWKGEASYYNIIVGDKTNENAAWYYPEPKPEAANIKDYVAFWNGVEVVD